jgi:four helix bundle protein
LEYIDFIYELASKLPCSEEYNLKSQITCAATSIALNIAEGSTDQTDVEQARFLGMAIRRSGNRCLSAHYSKTEAG